MARTDLGEIREDACFEIDDFLAIVRAVNFHLNALCFEYAVIALTGIASITMSTSLKASMSVVG